MNLPNKLTLLRVILVPFFIIAYMLEFYLAALIIFCVASITDYFDGNIARKRNLVTNFGKIMDPLADKVLVYSALCLFIESNLIKAWMLILILAREFIVAEDCRGIGRARPGSRNERQNQDRASDGGSHIASALSFNFVYNKGRKLGSGQYYRAGRPDNILCIACNDSLFGHRIRNQKQRHIQHVAFQSTEGRKDEDFNHSRRNRIALWTGDKLKRSLFVR